MSAVEKTEQGQKNEEVGGGWQVTEGSSDKRAFEQAFEGVTE